MQFIFLKNLQLFTLTQNLIFRKWKFFANNLLVQPNFYVFISNHFSKTCFFQIHDVFQQTSRLKLVDSKSTLHNLLIPKHFYISLRALLCAWGWFFIWQYCYIYWRVCVVISECMCGAIALMQKKETHRRFWYGNHICEKCGNSKFWDVRIRIKIEFRQDFSNEILWKKKIEIISERYCNEILEYFLVKRFYRLCVR